MKKNNIFLVIDSIFFDKTMAQKHRNSPMKFLNYLMNEKGLYCTNMYSEAPYTEAALVSLLCGIDTLKQGGYMKKLYGKKTILEVFKENGYDVFFNCNQPHVYPSYSYPGVTDNYYNALFDFNNVWCYRFKYYSEMFTQSGKLDKATMNMLLELLDDNLNTWQIILDKLKTNDKSMQLIIKYVDLFGLEEAISKLNKEIKTYKSNKIGYLESLLINGTKHNLFSIKTFVLDKKLSKEDKKNIYFRYKKILNKIFRKNFCKNIINNHIVLSKPFKFGKTFKLFKTYVNSFIDQDLYDKMNYNIDCYKAAPSMNATIEHFEKWLENRNTKKPFFAYMHVDDCHSPEMFYSYDCSNLKVLDQEFKQINDFIDDLPKKYRGSLAYDLSLMYADNCIKKLYKYLEKNDMIENTNIYICADHGSSYSFDPFHENYVNNVHRENYNLPFVCIGTDIKPEIKSGLYNSKDIPATIIDIAGISIPKDYNGVSVLKSSGRDYVLLENVNGGCPDYNNRSILLGVRNHNYLVVISVFLYKEFDDYALYEVYDLQKDKEERNNLASKKNIENKITNELKILENEFNLLKEDILKNNFLEEV